MPSGNGVFASRTSYCTFCRVLAQLYIFFILSVSVSRLFFTCLGEAIRHNFLGNFINIGCLFVCVEVLRPNQLYDVMSSAVSLPNHTFTRQA